MFEQSSAQERAHMPSGKEGNPFHALERSPENPVTKAAHLAVEAFNIPSGAFSGIATYRDAEGREQRIAPELDRAMAEHFTNVRHIVKAINGIGPITTKDPREKYAIKRSAVTRAAERAAQMFGVKAQITKIDAVIEKTKEDFASFREVAERVQARLASEGSFDDAADATARARHARAERLIREALELYDILIGELELKKRGFALLGSEEKDVRDAVFANNQLEVKYLPGGNLVILRGYSHDEEGAWQKNFGGNKVYSNGLATIYKNARYVAIEGEDSEEVGSGPHSLWVSHSNKDYSRLMKELVKNGFEGDFLEIDARYGGILARKAFDTKDLSDREGAALFAYQAIYNPDLAAAIKTPERFRKFFHKQRTEIFSESLVERELDNGIAWVEDGTYYHNRASVREDGSTSSVPTGFELGQVAFADALSVIKILIMNEAMNKWEAESGNTNKTMDNGVLEPGMIVDFQGANHLSYKSFFFDNPAYAMEVVLANVHEILASHPDVKDTDDILQKLAAMDRETWAWVFAFIGTIPFAHVAEPTERRDGVEAGLRQRPMVGKDSYVATEHLSGARKAELEEAIAVLVNAGQGK